MEWNLKPAWDFTEFKQEAIPNIDAVDGSSSRTKGNFSVDLKLGQINNSAEDSLNKFKEPGASKMESPSEPGASKMESPSPSGSSKRARAANNGSQTASCLVDGCDSDLSNCRDYHRRHKVCELHSKTPQVLICGQKQRFCQQCSRFHCLEEFDEGKRSCRKRLDGHNRRRRKPQPDPPSRTGTFLSNYQGASILPFSRSHMYLSATVVKPTWAGVGNTEADARRYNEHHRLNLPDERNLFLGSPSSSYKAGKQFTFLQADSPSFNGQASSEASASQPLLGTANLSDRSGASHNVFRDRSTTQDSDCALSLLSSPTAQTSGISLSQMMLPSSMPLVWPLGSSLHNHSVEPMESVLVSSDQDDNVHCPGVFHLGYDGSAGSDTPQTIPFQWE